MLLRYLNQGKRDRLSVGGWGMRNSCKIKVDKPLWNYEQEICPTCNKEEDWSHRFLTRDLRNIDAEIDIRRILSCSCKSKKR
jgi:hypothetical protein